MTLESRWWGTWKLSATDVQFSAPDGAGLGEGERQEREVRAWEAFSPPYKEQALF